MPELVLTCRRAIELMRRNWCTKTMQRNTGWISLVFSIDDVIKALSLSRWAAGSIAVAVVFQYCRSLRSSSSKETLVLITIFEECIFIIVKECLDPSNQFLPSASLSEIQCPGDVLKSRSSLTIQWSCKYHSTSPFSNTSC
jgi:hypothetical protein